MAPQRPTHRLLAFGLRFLAHDPGRVTSGLALTGLLAAMQGVGILMLVPLLAEAGLAEGATGGPVAAIADLFFDGLGMPRSLPVVLLAYVGLAAARAWIERRHALQGPELQLGFVRALRAELHTALLYAEWRFLAGSRRSDFVQVLTQDVQRAGNAVQLLLRGITGAAMVLVYAVIAFGVSPLASLLTVTAIGVLAFLFRDFRAPPVPRAGI